MSESVLSWKIFTPGGIVLGYDDGNTLVLSEDNYRKGLADGSIMKFSELETPLPTDEKSSVKKPSDTCMCITCGFARSIGSSLAGSRVWTSCDNDLRRSSRGDTEGNSKTADNSHYLKDCNCPDCQLMEKISQKLNFVGCSWDSAPTSTNSPIGMTQEQLDAALGSRPTLSRSECTCFICSILGRPECMGTPGLPSAQDKLGATEKDNHLYIPSCACKKCATATFDLKERSRRQKAQEKFDAKQNKKAEKRRAKFETKMELKKEWVEKYN